MTTRMMLGVFTILGAAALAPAHADTISRHGSLCAPKATSRDLVGADERGIYNASSTTTANVTCAGPDRVSQTRYYATESATGAISVHVTSYRPTLLSVVAHGNDLSSVVPYSCYLYGTDDSGFSSWGPTRYMCSLPGGCPDATSSFTGIGYLRWSIGGAFSDTADSFGVVCNLPPATGLGSSYLKAVVATDANQEGAS